MATRALACVENRSRFSVLGPQVIFSAGPPVHCVAAPCLEYGEHFEELKKTRGKPLSQLLASFSNMLFQLSGLKRRQKVNSGRNLVV